MEELLNKLIEKGYCPRGVKDVNIIVYNGIIKVEYRDTYQMYHIRELVSKESGLWQFVCENRKRGYTIPECWIKNPKICDEGIESVEKECNQNSYEYYIIESALKDESELEEFLLDNIKI